MKNKKYKLTCVQEPGVEIFKKIKFNVFLENDENNLTSNKIIIKD